MKTNLQIKGMPNQSSVEIEALATEGCTKFLIGWMRRFGNTLKLFVFPSNNKEHPDL
jgi:hypothetical protein